MRLSPLPALLPALILLGACLTEDSPPEPVIEDTVFAPSLAVDLAASTRLPSGMYIRDLTVGAGAVVQPGQVVSVRYTGWLADGTKFDERGPGAQPLVYPHAAGYVIAGWDIGLAGMRVGGVRQLVIPPDLGYGRLGQGPIPGNAILVFRVDLVAAQDP